ncbi:hypothetical protein CKO44_05930 [Rubrivivax gelatinosus]|uniref:H-NS family nucleoid-associated regulatory protein n=1 Tax=Rubrivivax gelatinosus TaxID=28068 RepID=UPI001906006A|nr:H-NS family nucleoid-associated regulatory protein [Rubrivivax gelatinosus]MBK1613011.1 hypothetical protein [Rubrivivax gelatinosus]MBZ8143347.1 hypothetical protein [Rubrivivax gelatinosus]
MDLANQGTGLQAGAADVAASRREQVAQQVLELVALYRISNADLRRILEEVDREREKPALKAQREAAQAHRRARERALHIARQLVEFWRIEPRELMAGNPAAARLDPCRAIKYQHPVTGDSWDGVGAQPEWLRRALGKQGYRVVELQPGTSEFHRAAEASQQVN